MIRNTRQRQAIEEVLRREARPLTLQEIHTHARGLQPTIGLRTVYRHVRDLSGQGKVVGLDYPGQPVRYEAVGKKHHAHFICRHCDKVLDLDTPIRDIRPDRIPEGFQITGQETIFYGVCPECAEDPEIPGDG